MDTFAALKTIKKNVAKLVEAEISATGGLLRLAPCWVPRSFLQPGKRLKLHPDDLYAYGLNRGGIDERWFASTTPAANENRTPDEGLSYVRRRQEALHARSRRSPNAARRSSAKRSGTNTRSGRSTRSSSTTWGRFRTTCTRARSRPNSGRAGRQAGVLLLPAAAQQRRQQLSLHLHGLRAGHDQGAGPQVPRELEQGRQRHPRSLQSVSPEARHRLAHRPVHPPRARLALHLRAAVGQRCLRHVSDRSSKAAKCRGACS